MYDLRWFQRQRVLKSTRCRVTLDSECSRVNFENIRAGPVRRHLARDHAGITCMYVYVYLSIYKSISVSHIRRLAWAPCTRRISGKRPATAVIPLPIPHTQTLSLWPRVRAEVRLRKLRRGRAPTAAIGGWGGGWGWGWGWGDRKSVV